MITTALGIARDQDNRAWEAFWLIEFGQVQRDLGNPDDALDATGEVHLHLGRPEDASHFHRRAVSTFREVGDDWSCALALDHLATALRVIGGTTEARSCWNEALTLLAEFPDPRSRRIQARIRETR